MRIHRKSWVMGIAVLMALALAACGGGGDPIASTAVISSDQPSDGDIGFDPVASVFTITQGPDTLFFGIDSLAVNAPEFRAFLTFPLGEIPLNAVIQSATLVVRVVSAEFSATIPAFVDLVSYNPLLLGAADFDSPPLLLAGGGDATIRINFFTSDVGFDVEIPVTLLMQEAQRRGLPDMQVRLLLALDAPPVGFVGIDDAVLTVTEPQLIVRFF